MQRGDFSYYCWHCWSPAPALNICMHFLVEQMNQLAHRPPRAAVVVKLIIIIIIIITKKKYELHWKVGYITSHHKLFNVFSLFSFFLFLVKSFSVMYFVVYCYYHLWWIKLIKQFIVAYVKLQRPPGQITENNYYKITSGYDFWNKFAFSFRWTASRDMAGVISAGRPFQILGSVAANERSPRRDI